MVSVAALTVVGGCGGDDGDGTDLGELDARCEALCDDDDEVCTEDVAVCELLCQVRVANVEPLCATCLLENSNAGICLGGEVCCPDPSFPSSVIDCAAVCESSAGVNPGDDHPMCADLCGDDDPACAEDASQCLDACTARVRGVSGLCANCLLDGTHNGVCVPGSPCCPDPEFPTSATDCAAVCGG